MEWLPFLNLIFKFMQPAAPVTGAGLVYDILQVLAALTILSRFGAWLSAKTETAKDDKFFARLGYWLGRITTLTSDLASGNLSHKRTNDSF